MPMLGELTPRMIRSASSPSSTKSSGCGSIRTSMPSRSKIGTSSSIERKNARSDSSARSGRPENSVLMTFTPRSTVICTTRFQLRTAASRASSSGPDHRSTGSTDAIPTPASAHALRNSRDQVVVGAGVVEERDEVPMRRQLQVLVAQIGYQTREVEQAVVVVERRRIQCDLHVHAPLIEERSTIWTSTGLPTVQRFDAGFADRGCRIPVPCAGPVRVIAGGPTGQDRVDPALELGVVCLSEAFPEAGRDAARPSCPVRPCAPGRRRVR